MHDIAVLEKAKYEKAWAVPEYSRTSPGAKMVRPFLEICKPWKGLRVIDFGCGSGAASLKLADMGFQVTGVDHVDVRKKGKKKYKFIQHCLWKKFDEDIRADYGFCCDVMEHIPEDYVDAVLENMFCRVRHMFLNISFTQDNFGDHPDIADRLHMTVRPYQWWKDKLEKYGQVMDGRDFMHSGIFHCKTGGKEMLTINREEAIEHLQNTLALNLPQVYGHQPQDRLTLLLAGGPSLNDFVDEIKEKREAGAALVTCNGTHDWAIEHGMIPSIQFLTDGRQFNERFVRNPQEDCQYILNSICHPDVFKNLGYSTDPNWCAKQYQVRIWHGGMYPEALMPIKNRHYFGQNFCIINGGSTVALRGLAILQTMGFRNIEAYGFDGCYGSAHAYDQPENGGEQTYPVTIAGREFQCSAWQVAQAQHFIDNVRGGVLNDISLVVHGDGLIAWIIQAGADGVLTDGSDIKSIQ